MAEEVKLPSISGLSSAAKIASSFKKEMQSLNKKEETVETESKETIVKENEVPAIESKKETHNETENKTSVDKIEYKITDEDKKILDSIENPFSDKTETSSITDKKDLNVSTESKTESTVDAEYQQYKQLTSNKEVKDFISYLNNGGTIDELNDLLKGSQSLVDNMNSESLVENYFKSLALNEKETEKSIEAFDDLPPYKQKIELTNFKEYLKKQEGEKPSKFSEVANKRKSEFENSKKEWESINKDANSKLKSNIQSIIDKDYSGIKVPKEIESELFDMAGRHSPPIYKDGKIQGYNIEEGIKAAMLLKYHDQIIKKAQKDAYDKGKENAYRAIRRPNSNEESSRGVSASDKNLSRDQKVNSAASKLHSI